MHVSKIVLENLKKSIFEYDETGIVGFTEEALQEGIDPIEAINALVEAITKIGDKFNEGELFLPELMLASKTMNNAMPILQDEIIKRGLKRESAGKIIIGTVYGDIHTIGINMVSTLLTSSGFEVVNLGCNVTSDNFIDAVDKYKPDILAMSALLTTTAPQQKKVIAALISNGIRNKVKVMVGGGAITAEFAAEIGADGYEPTAPLAVKLARILMEE
ncbi:MAG: cobalamin-binding protein [Actinobacteria bacterium]|nr:cobalamin-binding protein [Actinomycetota bacterium]